MPYSPFELRFWSKVNKKSDFECWEWMAYKNKEGYGKFKVGGKKGTAVGAHRIAFELTNGLIKQEEGKPRILVCHKCDNPPCCNPNHLFLGTDQDNVNDREKKGRNKIPMLKGADHGNAKLTEDQVRTIFHSNLKGKQLSKIFKVSQGLISSIRHRSCWKHLEMGKS